MMVVPIQIRPDIAAQLRIPADLTAEEAERISRVVLSYVDVDGVFRAPRPTWESYAKSMSALLARNGKGEG